MMFGLLVTNRYLIMGFFGPQWEAVVPLIMILAPVGMMESVSTMNGNIYAARGRTDLQFRVGLIFVALTTLSFVIGLRWGIVGVASGYALASSGLFYPSLAIPYRLIGLKVTDAARVLWRPFVNGAATLASLLAIRAAFPPDISNGLALGVLVVCGCITYVMASWALDRDQLHRAVTAIGLKTGAQNT
jgi:O-antigen/teichoic acid export membrane protein